MRHVAPPLIWISQWGSCRNFWLWRHFL